jgi:hypothetical protein
MLTLTANDLATRRKDLEQSAASALGKTLFAFSRLDMNLGLMLSWHLWSIGKEGQVKSVENMNFNTRLELLNQCIDGSATIPDGAKVELNAWLAQAHAARAQRNELVHGRWASDPVKDKVLNIVGLPSSDAQRTIEYSIRELEDFNHQIERLTSDMSQLRERWQLA